MHLQRDCVTVIWHRSSRNTKTSYAPPPPFEVANVQSVSSGGWFLAGSKPMTAEKQKRCFVIILREPNTKYYLESKDEKTKDIMVDGFNLMIRKIQTKDWPPSHLIADTQDGIFETSI